MYMHDKSANIIRNKNPNSAISCFCKIHFTEEKIACDRIIIEGSNEQRSL